MEITDEKLRQIVREALRELGPEVHPELLRKVVREVVRQLMRDNFPRTETANPGAHTRTQRVIGKDSMKVISSSVNEMTGGSSQQY
jgi:hypothetical protein